MVSRFGEVITVSGNTVVVKGEKITPQHIGKIVIDKQMKNVGRVVDVFGPVDSPYAKVILFPKSGDFCGTVLYVR
jgi:RNA-binding protein